MPRIFDNIDRQLLPALKETLVLSQRADYCVGYFNLRGWKQVDRLVEQWPGGEGNCCRLLVGMQQMPKDQLRSALSLLHSEDAIDQSTAIVLKKKLAQEFRDQLTIGVPTNEDEAGLRRLAAQLESGKLVVKLFLRHSLHAKLYLHFRQDPLNPKIAYLGSSNLTFAGLSKQGELNVDILDHDACDKLSAWFDDRWNDRFCIDISKELIEIINTSWARTEVIPPYHIYVKMAYHLAQEARLGLSEFRIPSDFGNQLFDFQKAAVKIAAHHLNKRGGVVIGDVVGLGKTLMATALARVFEDDHGLETLIICPKNLVPMWEDYRIRYRLRAKVLSITRVEKELPDLRRFRQVIIDESHNLRNREGKRYRAINEYLSSNDSKVILLSATPYNKTFLDLSNQLRLFIDESDDIGVRPEKLLRELGETEFIRRHQCPVRSLAAFEKSEYADDWRDLMRLYLVRRTRTFIQENYAKRDPVKKRDYLEFADGTRSYFPTRVPKTVKVKIDEDDPNDQYALLFSDKVVRAINKLRLPRYGLGNYEKPTPRQPPTNDEAKVLNDLSRAGTRLMGFCRTNLFKRLESSGYSFILSVERHILRNFIFIHAIENDLPIPIGTQDVGLLDTSANDEDSDLWKSFDEDSENGEPDYQLNRLLTESDYRERAADIYQLYSGRFRKRFRWLPARLFEDLLVKDLTSDAKSLMKVLKGVGAWDSSRDAKLNSLVTLLTQQHFTDKVLLFSQFSDTIEYLYTQLRSAGVESLAQVTGATENPTAIVQRFSPISNDKSESIKPSEEIRVLLATDVLSEGQNLQDCSVIVNFDLPWAIIRLIQRAGRVDRIGQQSDTILCYSFLPADGVERIINLRGRVRQRLKENAEVVGTDEAFFDDEDNSERPLVNLYNEKAGILDGEDDATEVDLASYAYQIWKNAIDREPELERLIPAMPDVVYSTKPHLPTAEDPEGTLVYLRTAEGTDALAWMDLNGKSVTESQYTILRMAECQTDTPAVVRHERHHELVAKGVRLIVDTEKSIGGQLGRPSGARFRTYERLKSFADDMKGTLFETGEHGVQLKKAIEDIHRAPLLQSATDLLNRQLKSGISDHDLADLVVGLRQDARLCRLSDEEETSEPQVICSMGLRNSTSGAQPRIELATFTLVFEKSNDTKFTPAERQQCAEEGRKAVLRMLQGLNDDATIKIELVEIGSGSGSYWQEYAAYIVGFVGLAGGVGNAIHIIAEGLIQTGNLTAALAESMKSSGAWLKRTAWRFNAQNVSPELSVRQPYCFGIREYLDRRTKRCRDCTFRNDCVAAIEGS